MILVRAAVGGSTNIAACSDSQAGALQGDARGLRVFLEQTQGQSPVMCNALAAFGFVYIHPLADGKWPSPANQ